MRRPFLTSIGGLALSGFVLGCREREVPPPPTSDPIAESSSEVVEAPREPFVEYGPSIELAMPEPPPAPPKKRCAPPDMGGPRRNGFRSPQVGILGGTVSSDGCYLALWNQLGELLYFDVEASKLLARVRPAGGRAIPAGFIDERRVAFCGDNEQLHLWDGRSPPVDIAKLDPARPPYGCRELFVDQEAKRIAVLGYPEGANGAYTYFGCGGGGWYDAYAPRPGQLVVYDYQGNVVAKRANLGVNQAAFRGEWFTAIDLNVDLQRRRFYSLRDVEAEPVETWPETAAFPNLGRGPDTFESYGALVLHNFRPGEKPLEIPRKRGIPMTGAYAPEQKHVAIAYRADREGARTGVAIFDPSFTTEIAFVPDVTPSGFVWASDGDTLVAFEGLHARYIDASSGKPLGVITAGVPPTDSGELLATKY